VLTKTAPQSGDIAAVYGWNTNNNYLGQAGGSFIDRGDFHDFTIDQNVGGQRAEYVGLSAENDAVCVAWVTVSQFDDTRGSALTGDVGSQCGQNWYENVEIAGFFKDGGDYRPRCSWLDGDMSEGIPSAAMKFASSYYGEKTTDSVNDACGGAIWGADTGPISGTPGGAPPTRRDLVTRDPTTLPISQRNTKPRQQWMEEKLVVSNITTHRAENLCGSVTSWGPDFVGSDGQYCDMTTKTLTPICDAASPVDSCYDIDHSSKTVLKRTTVGRREVQLPHKSFKQLSYWS
jgi:hypothetical protein